ncbi:MAG: sn-glycerol-3-phosphate ABC transporter substrate-binding protein UgpB [Candidatus Rokubacteria bacterium]|nr:sn-glycerol-3-phosphate ABC transporter substrate-binding protein UgpB [Candidatus Rokubacteria bacterium]MBI3825397.1 sn-glycerol-3-phosphate ABC transporter substrate-binding protein UgpB [Candidatus Rokubacteria bacterium]
MKVFVIAALATVLALAGLPAESQAKTEIQWWHAMQGVLGERVNEIAAKFNASQSDYEVKAVFKGAYPDTLNAAIAAYRAKQPPHVVQVFEVGTQTMLSSGAVYPVFQLMKDNGIAIDWNDVIGPVKSYYATGGNLASMAFNSSTPILYYNRDLFKKAGLADKAPATWDEIEAAAKKLVAAGAKCGYSSAWPSWVLMENMHALHDQPFADHANGFDGLATTLKINGPFGVKMMELLARGAKEGWFTYNGRLSKAEANMGGGECGIFTTSSAYIAGLTRASEGKFTWGTGPLPKMGGFPQGHAIIGGASLWVLKGAKPEEYKGVAQFFKYLASVDNQAWWAGITGYLPISNTAVKAMETSGHFQKNPQQKTAITQMNAGKTTPNSQGIRLGNFVSIRDGIEEQMENIFSGKKSPKQGLDDAVAKGNEILKEFAALYK